MVMKSKAKTNRIPDKRRFSGARVLARCEVLFRKDDPFATWNPAKTGHVALNVRGGCLYLGEYYDEQNIEKLFPDNGSGTFERLTLSADNWPDIVLENVKVVFLRLRKEDRREGIVFRFVDITEQQLDLLDDLTSSLPNIGACEQTSVPFNGSMHVERPGKLELVK